jgi:multiple sugar transport system substrate-binding protein
MRRHIVSISVALALVLAIVALVIFNRVSVGVDERDSVVRVYYADNISPAHQSVIDRFNALHEGRVEVVPVNLPFEKFSTNERKELLARSLRNKSDRLDIFTVDHIWVARFSRWCEPLDSLVSADDRSRVLSQAEESCFFNGRLMAIPMYIDIGLLYYRADLMKRLRPDPAFEERLRSSLTWDEFRAVGRDAGAQGWPFYFFQANDYEGLTCNFFELIAGQDEKFFTHRPIDFERPEPRRALEVLVDFASKDGISPREVCEFDEIRSYTQMLERDGVAVRGWPNFLESYRRWYADTSKLSLVARAPLPHFAGHKPVSVFGGWNFMISRFSARKKEAVELARFFQRVDMQKILFEVGGYIPTNMEVYADTAYMQRHPVLQYYAGLIRNGFHRPALMEYTKMSDIVSRAANRAVKGEISIDSALHDMNAQIRAAGAME